MAENAVPVARAPGPQVDLADDAYSLPSRYYIDPEILELEYERIFYRAWNFAGHISQLKTSGDYITCTVGRESIIVMVGDSGALHAFLQRVPSPRALVVRRIGERGFNHLSVSRVALRNGRPSGVCQK